MQIIGLSGYARSGKDEAAKVLVEEFGFTRVAFADKLREVLYALNPIVGFGWYDQSMHYHAEEPIYVQNIIDQVGWDGYKSTEYGTEIRRLLQRLGTEAGRQTMWDDIWVDAALTGLSEDARVVVTDCRFPNEAEAIKERDGYVVRVNRKDNGPAKDADGNVHKSETSLDDWKFDYTLTNNWDKLEDYHEYIRGFADAYGEDQYFKHVIGDEI